MDRNTAVVPKQQLGFYNFIVRPMYAAMDLLVDMGPQLVRRTIHSSPRMGWCDTAEVTVGFEGRYLKSAQYDLLGTTVRYYRTDES